MNDFGMSGHVRVLGDDWKIEWAEVNDLKSLVWATFFEEVDVFLFFHQNRLPADRCVRFLSSPCSSLSVPRQALSFPDYLPSNVWTDIPMSPSRWAARFSISAFDSSLLSQLLLLIVDCVFCQNLAKRYHDCWGSMMYSRDRSSPETRIQCQSYGRNRQQTHVQLLFSGQLQRRIASLKPVQVTITIHTGDPVRGVRMIGVISIVFGFRNCCRNVANDMEGRVRCAWIGSKPETSVNDDRNSWTLIRSTTTSAMRYFSIFSWRLKSGLSLLLSWWALEKLDQPASIGRNRMLREVVFARCNSGSQDDWSRTELLLSEHAVKTWMFPGVFSNAHMNRFSESWKRTFATSKEVTFVPCMITRDCSRSRLKKSRRMNLPSYDFRLWANTRTTAGFESRDAWGASIL